MNRRELADQLERAIELAVKFHRGQRDKSGMPYVTHLISAMARVDDPVAKQAAVLHDLLEDTPAKVDDLHVAGIHQQAIEAIKLLTHNAQDRYQDYIVRLKANPIAVQCKLADIHDNFRLDRVAYRERHASSDARRIQRYIATRQFLCDEIDEATYRRMMGPLEENGANHSGQS